jgi:hypothetical protein
MEDTLVFFDSATVVLGKTIRKFSQTVCSHYHTTELPHEHAACGRWMAALAAKQPQNAQGRAVGVKVKLLNLQTYKYHALGDYPNTIQHMGTTDSYSTQPVSVCINKVTFTYTLCARVNCSTAVQNNGTHGLRKSRQQQSKALCHRKPLNDFVKR